MRLIVLLLTFLSMKNTFAENKCKELMYYIESNAITYYFEEKEFREMYLTINQFARLDRSINQLTALKLVGGTSYKDLLKLRSNEIEKIETKLDEISTMVNRALIRRAKSEWQDHTPARRHFNKYKRRDKNLIDARDVFRSVNDNYNLFFIQWLRMQPNDIPWSEIEKLEKGITIKEVMNAFDDVLLEGLLCHDNKVTATPYELGIKILQSHFTKNEQF